MEIGNWFFSQKEKLSFDFGFRSNADGTNYIVMNFDSDVKIRTFDIFLKNAEGLTIECYDVAGDLIYTGSVSRLLPHRYSVWLKPL